MEGRNKGGIKRRDFFFLVVPTKIPKLSLSGLAGVM